MSKIMFTENGFKDYLYWQTQDKKTLKKINRIIQEIERNSGIGKAELLKGNLQGFYSRRIDEYNRIVYQVKDDVIEIVTCKGHYGK